MNLLPCLKDICEELYYEEKGQRESNPYVIIPVVRDDIFDFEYPLFDASYKANLETMILKKYYTRDICSSQFWRWKMFLDSKMNEIMPYYNQMYESLTLQLNPLYNFTVDVSHEDSGGDVLNTTQSKSSDVVRDTSLEVSVDKSSDLSRGETTQNENKSELSGTDNVTVENVNKFSNTPQGSLSGIEEGTYLTEATIDDETNSTEYGKVTTDTLKQVVTGKDVTSEAQSKTEAGTLIDNTEESLTKVQNIVTTRAYIESVSGRRDATDAELLIKYRESFVRVDEMLLNELNDCFSLVY